MKFTLRIEERVTSDLEIEAETYSDACKKAKNGEFDIKQLTEIDRETTLVYSDEE